MRSFYLANVSRALLLSIHLTTKFALQMLVVVVLVVVVVVVVWCCLIVLVWW